MNENVMLGAWWSVAIVLVLVKLFGWLTLSWLWATVMLWGPIAALFVFICMIGILIALFLFFRGAWSIISGEPFGEPDPEPASSMVWEEKRAEG